MPSWNAYSFIFGPLIGFLGLGIMILVLKWGFRRGGSLIARPAEPGKATEYGLLVPIASPNTFIEGEVLRRTLIDAGIKANLANTNDGPRVMVWPKDEKAARQILSRGPGASRAR